MTSPAGLPPDDAAVLVEIASAGRGRPVAEIAAAAMSVATSRVRIARTCAGCGSDRHGRPVVLLDGRESGWFVSVSHTPSYDLVAVTDAGPVGVDAEVVPGDADGAARAELVTWVRTEAVLKATGHGLRLDPRRLALSAPHHPPRVMAWADGDPASVCLRDLTVTLPDAGVTGAPPFVAAVAILGLSPEAQLSIRTAGAAPRQAGRATPGG